MTTKFIVVTVFPNKTRTAIPVSDIGCVHEDSDGHAILYLRRDNPSDPYRADCVESFDTILGRLNHVD